MSEIAIRARNVTKAYRLHDSPGERLLDLFGILKDADRKVKKHLALQDVSFDIYRGEKIAIIGRNGAGKSTLLKMITRVTEPTSGTLEVRGQSRALLQIGTGFHFDFTGRENVAAYLASLGVDDKAALPLIEDAIAFAELEEFADQPVKTYSTGMAMRLMFAASTMMKPDLLVIDEVLGVGDAYFQRKSFERIREMCDGRETTLILVTHDIYSAAALCDRMIWIDRGRVLIDADPPTVMRAYEDAMREQEERRLRQKALKASAERGEKARKERVIVEIQTQENQPPDAPVWISRISLLNRGMPLASARFGQDAFDEIDGARLLSEGVNWSEAESFDGRLARALKTHGSPFHKVGAIFEIDSTDSNGEDRQELSAIIDYRCDAPVELLLTITTSDRRIALGELPSDARAWRSHTASGVLTPHYEAAHETGFDTGNWKEWIVASPDTRVEFNYAELSLQWDGPPGPYLLTTPPLRPGPHQTVLFSLHADIRSGRLGVGALNGQGQWSRIYELDSGVSNRALEFSTGDDGELTLVLYSATHQPLHAKLTPASEAAAPADASVNTQGVYGAGDIRVEGFRVFNHDDIESLALEVGKRARFEIDYRIVRPDMKEHAQVLIAFHKSGVQDVLRTICRDFLFDYSAAQTGTLSIEFDPLPLPTGAYSIPVVIAAEGYYDKRQTLYFSINPDMYFLQSVAAEIQVSGFWQLYEGATVVGEAKWTRTTEQVANPPSLHIVRAKSG